MLAAFVLRLVGYALLLGVVSYVAQSMWLSRGLDAVAALQPLHDAGVVTLLFAPVVLALAGARGVRPVAAFVAGVLAGAALTAPFACGAAAGG